MTLHKLSTPYSLVTDVDEIVLALANILNVDTSSINPTHDHIYITNIYDENEARLISSAFRAPSDVCISPENFCELFIDILSGMPAKKAYNKQGYTF